MAASAQADALQRKIFSRYVNQKLSTSRGIAVDDVVEQGKTGVLLFNLIEVLSEVSFTEKYNQAPKLRVHSLDNCNRALKFAKDQGVSMKVFPQAENLVDGDEKAVLGLIWSIILKFMKFGDADESLNAKDALLMWVQNKTAGYEGVDVKDFKSSIKDGVALGAVIHRHRPAMIDMNTLTPGAANAVANWKIVQDAAERYFGLEKYITPEEILKLDENSMVIYVSDYYYGIAEQRKVDLAARRLTKLIDYTKVNDDLRQQYQDRAHSFTTRVAKVREVLNDRTIDNTMEGAKRRIAEFYEYKTTDKSAVLADQLNIEGLYNSLSMRLANGKRPAYQPPAGTDLLAMNATVAELEKTEQERKTALHAELNRQIKLLDFDRQHTEQSAKLSAYQAETQAYLETKEVSHSVSAAEYQVRRLDASDEERHNVYQSTFAKLKDLGAYLESEHYERTGEVKGREAALQASFDNLEAASNAKRPVLLDDLAREKFREEIRLKNEQHISDFNHLLAWVAESEAYLQKKEHVDSVADANRHQGLLQAYVASKDAQTKNTVSALKALGSHIVSARYQGISTYQFGDAPDPAGPATVADRESQVDAKWVLLDQLHADKKSILDDDLARETFRRGLALRNQQHIKQFDQISAWAAASAAYLRTKEVVDSVSEAQTALAILSAYADDKVTQTSSSVAHLKNVGQEILNAKYEGPHSSYTFGSAATDAAHPADIHQREQKVDELWQELDGLHADKKAVLDDDLARETFREGLQVQNSIHSNAFDSLKAYAAEGKQYLEAREHIDDIPKANTAISTLTGFREGKTQKSNTAVASFKQLGQQIVSAKYETGHSSYTFGSAASDKVHPSDLAQREQEVDQLFAQLDELAAAKDGWLASELDREQKKEQKRVEFANQASAFSRFTIERANEAQATHFGFTLAEVEEFAAKLDASDASINASAQQSLDSAVATFQAGAELGVKDNAYTKASPDSLQAEADKLKAQLGERRKRYQAELERQRYLDGLCRDFATVADPFAANIVASKNEISNSQAELVDQLAFVNNRIAQAHGADQQGLQAIQAAQQKLDDEGVTNNIHTTQTAKDIQVQHQQFIVFLERKKTMLEEAIEQAKLRGLTPAQFQEIESNFKQFDADADGVINARELKACLYSLGEEKGPKQVAEILEKHGNGKNAIEYPQFREFLINLFGDADTKDEILHGFQLINRRTDGITTQERMALVLPENDVNYITTTAPASGEGYDAVAWTESVFAR